MSSGNLLIVGDFNYHVDVLSNKQAQNFLEVLHSLGLTQHINISTHKLGHTLDLVMTRTDQLQVHNLSVCSTVPSDHLAVVFYLPISVPLTITKSFQQRKWKNISMQKLHNDLSVSDLNGDPVIDAGEGVKRYNHVLQTLLEKHAPSKDCTVEVRSDIPWYNSEIKYAKITRCRLERIWRKSRLVGDRDAYVKQKNAVKSVLKRVRSNYFRSKIENAQGQSELFKVTNKLLNSKSEDALPACSSSNCLSESFSDYFKTKIELVRHELKTKMQSHASVTCPPAIPESLVLLDFERTSVDEVERIVKAMKNKSCSLDPMPTWLLKKCLNHICPFITQIINSSFDGADVPSELKQALVRPLLKKTQFR